MDVVEAQQVLRQRVKAAGSIFKFAIEANVSPSTVEKCLSDFGSVTPKLAKFIGLRRIKSVVYTYELDEAPMVRRQLKRPSA